MRSFLYIIIILSYSINVFGQMVLVDDAPFCGHHDTTTFSAIWDSLRAHGATVHFTSSVGRFPTLSGYDLVILMHHNYCSSAGFSYSQRTQLIDFVCHGGNLLIMPIVTDDVSPHNQLLGDSRWATGLSFDGSGGRIYTTNIASLPPLTNGVSHLFFFLTALINVSPPAMPFVWDSSGTKVIAAISYPRRLDGEDCDCHLGGRIVAIADCHTFEVPVVGYAEPMDFRFIINTVTALARVSGDTLQNCIHPEGVPIIDSTNCADPGDTVNIWGDGFPDSVVLLFDGDTISFTRHDSTHISFVVPDSASQGIHTATLIINGRRFSTPIRVYCDWLEISLITPYCADVGDTVYFYGSNFSDSAIIHFGDSLLDTSQFEITSDTTGWLIIPDTTGIPSIGSFLDSRRFSICIENEPTQVACASILVPCPCPPESAADISIEIIDFFERTDGTDTVYIIYNLDADTIQNIILFCSSDGGSTWTVPCTTLFGDVGDSISPGESLIISWAAGVDVPDTEHSRWAFMIQAVEHLPGSASDTLNYIVRDSDDPGVTFSWIDTADGDSVDTILCNCTAGYTCDDSYHRINLPFIFTFYGDTHSFMYVSTNGFITFNTAGAWWWINDPIPDASAPNNYIAALWDDIYIRPTSCLYVVFGGTTPNRWVAVIWRNVGHYLTFSSATFWTFELIIYEDGTIVFQYLDLNGCPLSGYDYGGSATVGLENASGTGGYQYSYNSAVLSDSFRIEFIPSVECPYGAIFASDISELGPVDTRKPSVSVNCPPNGNAGESTTISWTVVDSFIPPLTLGPPFPITISYSTDGGGSWHSIGTYENNGSTSWRYPNVIADSVTIRLCAIDSFGHIRCDTCGPFSITGDTTRPWGYAYSDTCSPDSVVFVVHDSAGIDWSSVCILDPIGILCYPDSMDVINDTILVFHTRLPNSLLDGTVRRIIRMVTLSDSNGNTMSESILEDSMTVFFRHPCCYPAVAWRVCPEGTMDTIFTSCAPVNVIFAVTDTSGETIDTSRIYLSRRIGGLIEPVPRDSVTITVAGDTVYIGVLGIFSDSSIISINIDSIFTTNNCKTSR